MELLEAQPQVLRSKGFPWEPMTLIPIGDIQMGADGFAPERFKRYLKNALAEPNPYFIGMGDYSDFLSPSNRKRLKAADLYDSAQEMMDAWVEKHLDDVKELLEPTKGRWIGMLQGHHYHEFDIRTTTDTELARFLDAPFLGDCAMTRLSFKYDKGSEGHYKTQSVTVWAHHGAGSGVSAASALTKLERFAGYVDADILLMGHQSKKGYLPKPRFGISRMHTRGVPQLENRTQHLVATGAWMEGYHVGSRPLRGRPQGSYVEKAMMVPTALGGMVVRITPQFRDQIKIRVEGGDD